MLSLLPVEAFSESSFASSPMRAVLKVRMPLPMDVPISGSRRAPNINKITTTIIAISGMPRGPTLMSFPPAESGGPAHFAVRCV